MDSSTTHAAGSAPDLSVIVPVRNEAADIAALLGDLLDQTLAPQRYEILVVDGRSGDGTREIVADLARTEPRLRLLDNPRLLSASARNIGAAAARGANLLFVDGHCRVASRSLLADTLAAFGDGARCLSRPQPFLCEGAGDFARAAALARSSVIGHHVGSHIYRTGDGWVDPISAGCAYTRELFLGLGGMDESFDACEDLEFNWRVGRAGVRARHDPAFTVWYRPRSGLGALLRQLYRYGYGRARMLRKHGRSLSASTTAVAILVAALLGLPLAALLWPPLLGAWAVGVGLYLVLIGAVAATLASRAGWRLAPAVASSLVAAHLGAGLGYLAGLVHGPDGSHRPRRGRSAPEAGRSPEAARTSGASRDRPDG